jgi:tripartite-type tricarboxylate transporter receptor subunit TctC
MGVNIIGSVPHMAAAELAQAAGVDFRYITQKTNPGSVIALMGGHVDAAMGLGPQMIAYGDDIRAIATFAAERNPSFPDVPTTTEQGYDISAFALSGPAVKKGTPQEIVDRLEAAFMEVLANPEYQAEAKRRGQFIASERQWSREATEASWADSVTSYTAMLNQLGLIE